MPDPTDANDANDLIEPADPNDPTATPPAAPRVTTAHWGALWALVRPYRMRWWIATASLFVASIVNLGLPQIARLGIDDALKSGDLDRLDTLGLMALGGFALLAVFVFIRHYLMSWIGNRVVADLRTRTFRHLLTMPPSFFHQQKSGELVSRLTSDIEKLQHAVGSELSVALRSALTVIGGITVLVMTSPQLTLIMLAVVPGLAVGAVVLGKLIRRRSREVQDLIAEANGHLKEAVTAIDTVQVFGAQARVAGVYENRVFGAFRTLISVTVARGAFIAGVQFAGSASLAFILWLGARMVNDDALDPGELVAFLLYTMMVTSAMATLADIWANLQRSLGASARVFDLLDERPEISSPPDARPVEDCTGALSFKGVSFRYPSRPDQAVLTDISFEAHAGQTVALVGPSGAGKSTVAALVQRFYDPEKGAVLLDGHPLNTLDLEGIRAIMATVGQEPALFSGSIGENIRFGRADATDAEVRQAAHHAHIGEFIEGLAEGYESAVGERGVKLSGGQRQRIAIARALLADPRVLILDEATSHLDTVNEEKVQAALSQLMMGRTTLVIAHRLSTVRHADLILVLENGHLVERGTHESLMNDGPIYRRLVAAQMAEPAGPNSSPSLAASQ